MFRWSESSGYQTLTPIAEQTYYEITGMSDDGSVLVGDMRPLDNRSATVFRWTEENGPELLEGLDGFEFSAVKQMTPDGHWLAGISANPPNFEPEQLVPWLYSENTGFLNLLDVFEAQGIGPNLAGWTSIVSGFAGWFHVSGDAHAITGTGFNSDGFMEGWVAYLDPLEIVGDAKLDGEFNSGDFTSVFLAGEYEDSIDDNSGWAQGDWNGDGDFTSGDFITAFLDGGYEQGPRPAMLAVPEPNAWLILVLGLAGAMFRRRRR